MPAWRKYERGFLTRRWLWVRSPLRSGRFEQECHWHSLTLPPVLRATKLTDRLFGYEPNNPRPIRGSPVWMIKLKDRLRLRFASVGSNRSATGTLSPLRRKQYPFDSGIIHCDCGRKAMHRVVIPGDAGSNPVSHLSKRRTKLNIEP